MTSMKPSYIALEKSRAEEIDRRCNRHGQTEALGGSKTQRVAERISWSAGLSISPKPRVKGMKSCPYSGKKSGGPPVLDGLSKGQLFALWKASEKTLNARLKEAVRENQELKRQIEILEEKGH